MLVFAFIIIITTIHAIYIYIYDMFEIVDCKCSR